MTGAGKGRNSSAMSDGSELSNLVSPGGAGIQGVDTKLTEGRATSVTPVPLTPGPPPAP
jgi:hypothetical protein